MTIKGPLKIEKILAIIIIFVFILYSAYESYNLITGPKITILSPENGSSIDNNWFLLEGIAKNVSFISLNDRKIFIDDKGNFKEKLLLPYGYTIIKIDASDRFGKKVNKTLSLYRPKQDGNIYEEIQLNKTSTSTEESSTTPIKKQKELIE